MANNFIYKQFILTLLVIFVILGSCYVNRNTNFCKIVESDQSNLYMPEGTKEENQKALVKRKQIFLNNFKILIKEFKSNKIPIIGETEYLKDTCLKDAILVTFIHISQTRPDLFYSENITKLLMDQIQRNRLDPEVLYTAIKIGSNNTTCDSLKPKIIKAIRLWQIDESLYKRFKFKEC